MTNNKITTPKEQIMYGYMDKDGNVSSHWFYKYEDATKYALINTPIVKKPIYILEKFESYKIVEML